MRLIPTSARLIPTSARRALLHVAFAVSAICWIAGPAAAQDGRWTSHTSMRQITDVSASSDAIWAATTGGVFRYLVESGEMSSFTASDGLHNVQTQAIAYDPVRNLVWIGYRSGVIDRLDPETGTIRTFRDIERADRFSSREIHSLLVRGDSVFVATSFGLVVFDPVRNEVRDTYSQLGTIDPGTAVYDAAIAPGPDGAPTFWLATNNGIAHAPLSTANLQDPSSWTVEQIGLPSAETRSIAAFDGTIYVGTMQDMARRESDGGFTGLGRTNSAVFDLLEVDGRLIGAERFDLVVVDTGGESGMVDFEPFTNPISLVHGPDGLLWVGDAQGGLVAVEPPSRTQAVVDVVRGEVYPSGPYDNLFTEMQVDHLGNLWVAGEPELRTGFSRFDPSGQWTNYVAQFVPEFGGSDFSESIHADAEGNVWAGSEGNGLVQILADGSVRRFGQENSTLSPALGTNDFILVGGIASDEQGNVWVTNRASEVQLHVYDQTGEWTPITQIQCGGFSSSTSTLNEIFIDSFGQKWVQVIDRANLRRVIGLIVLDTNGTPTDTDDDVCNYFSGEGAGGQGLPGAAVTSVKEDRDGLIWIGTENGLAYMINNGIVAGDPSAAPIWPQLADRTQGTFLLSGIKINDIAVDPANKLWVATDEGVSVVQQVEGGYELLETFTDRNSPLFSNVVVAIEIDPSNGRAYMATDQGLISYESGSIAASEQVEDLKVYPNPVRIQDGNEPSIFVDGLIDETDLRVVTLDGEVVARMETRGGRAQWNGRDLTGDFVPSGVYLVIAVGSNGEGAAYGKVAVIR